MSLVISKVFTYDEDAATYIQAVEAADAQALEPATRKAINNFVIGCKQDNIWSAIKASCILAGARTLAGALIPLVGTAPTNNNFVSGDYNRKTGLVGDGSTKYLNSNRNNNAESSQNSKHMAVYATTVSTISNSYIGMAAASGSSHFGPGGGDINVLGGRINSTAGVSTTAPNTAGFLGVNRSTSADFLMRGGGVNISTASNASTSPASGNLLVFDGVAKGNGRLAFYSIGESLDLARLDSRVTDLITAFGVTIP